MLILLFNQPSGGAPPAPSGKGKAAGGRSIYPYLVSLQQQWKEEELAYRSLQDAQQEANRQAFARAMLELEMEQKRQNAIFSVLLSEL